MDSDDQTQDTEWSWIYSWAGGVHELVALVNPSTPAPTLTSALYSLDLLVDAVPSARKALDKEPAALTYLLSLPSPRHALQVLLEDPSFQSHPSILKYCSSPHSAAKVQDARRLAAWTGLEASTAKFMATLKEVGPGDVTLVDDGEKQSRLARLLDLACAADAGTEPGQKTVEDVLDILKVLPEDKVVVGALVPRLTRLIVLSRLSGSDRVLPFGVNHTRPVLKTLFGISTTVVNGVAAYPAVVELAKPFLLHINHDDPLRIALSFPRPSPTVALSHKPDQVTVPTGLAEGLQDPASARSPVIVTPEILLAAISPAYLDKLRSAPIPPLGIRSTMRSTHVGSQASAFAGKVYSQHEFRGKDMSMPQGLGPSTAFSRPASKHVDAYVV